MKNRNGLFYVPKKERPTKEEEMDAYLEYLRERKELDNRAESESLNRLNW